MRKSILTAITLMLSASAAGASEVCYTNMTEGDVTSYIGYGATHYEVAIRMDDDRLPGKQLSAIEMSLADVATLSNVEVFLAYRLDKSLKPVYTQSVTPTADGMVRVELDTPFELATTSIYVGYRLDCSSATAMPIGCVARHSGDYAYCYRTAATDAWTNASETMTAAMRVYLSGDFGANSVQLGPVGEVNVEVGKSCTVMMPIWNTGTSAVTSVSYQWTLGEHSGSGTYTFDTPVAPTVGSCGMLPVEVPASAATGEYESSVTVTAVNGEGAVSTCPVSYNVIAYFPVHRPLVEEYTGGWCGNCVAGMATMEMMTDRYGDDFVVVAIHDQDHMAILSEYPCGTATFPSAWLNRSVKTHPCYGDGTTDDIHGFEPVWQRVRELFTPVSISAEAQWTDDEMTRVAVSLDVEAVRSVKAPCRLGVVLVADGITGTRWTQSNYLAGGEFDDPYMAKYAAMDHTVSGFVWNDVAIHFDPTTGIAGSLPAELAQGQVCSYPTTINLDAVSSTLVQDKSKMRVVAFVYNPNSGKVLNAVRTPITGGAGIGGVTSDPSAEVVAEELYDLTGRRVAPTARGLLLRRATTAEGTVTVDKVVR